MSATGPRNLSRLQVRAATLADARDIWIWRNDPETRAHSGTRAPVAWEDHMAWLSARLRCSRCAIYIVQALHREAGPPTPVAVVRFDQSRDGPDCWTLSLNVRPDWRGRGIGREALAAACRALFETHGHQVLRAEIHPRNIASIRVFSGIGFVRLDRSGPSGLDLYERPPEKVP